MPLAATWMMMAVEGPFLAAIIARLPDPEFNLGAYGVTFAFALLVEAPVIMLMTASTALAEDATSFRRLRTFAYTLGAASTAVLLLLLIPGVYGALMEGVIALPREIASLTYGSLWILLPWPAAIGYRRFYQGLLIRDGKTRLVALGTVVRLAAMSATALVLFVWVSPPGAYLAAAALSMAVTVEAAASRWMARGSVAKLAADSGKAAGGRVLSYGGIARFYYPLALTSLIGLAVQPMLTFFMGRAPSPIESLAVFPVVSSLAFVFRAVCLAYQEVTIALLGRGNEHLPELRTFAWSLGLATSVGIALFAVTPLAGVWFETVSGLTTSLASFAIVPTMILIPVPFLSAFLSFFRGILVNAHVTRPITVATAIEVATIAAGFPLLAWGLGTVGVTAAAGAFLVGRAAAVGFLVPRVLRVAEGAAARS